MSKKQPELTAATAAKALALDVGNVLGKVRSGKPLTASERRLIEKALAGPPTARTSAKTTGAPRLGTAVSLTAAAALLGISKAAVQAAKAAGCPAFARNGNVHCDELVRWLATHPEVLEAAGDKVDRSLEQALKTRAERRLREHQLGLQQGKFVAAEDVERDTADMIATAKAVLLAGPAAIAPQVVGVSIPEAELILREWLHTSLSKLQQDPLGRNAPTAT